MTAGNPEVQNLCPNAGIQHLAEQVVNDLAEHRMYYSTADRYGISCKMGPRVRWKPPPTLIRCITVFT